MNPILSLINTTAARFDEKLQKDTQNEGFLAYVGDEYEAVDFDTDVIKTFLREAQLETLEVVKQIAAWMNPPVFMMQDGVSADFSARDAYSEALKDLIQKLSVKE